MSQQKRRLHPRGAAARGVVVDSDGAMLGPDCVLVRRSAGTCRCVLREEAAAIQNFLFGVQADDPDRLFGLSRGIAKALNEGEVALAQIYGLRIPVAKLASRELAQLAAAATFIKANFNPASRATTAAAGIMRTEAGRTQNRRVRAVPAAARRLGRETAAIATVSLLRHQSGRVRSGQIRRVCSCDLRTRSRSDTVRAMPQTRRRSKRRSEMHYRRRLYCPVSTRVP